MNYTVMYRNRDGKLRIDEYRKEKIIDCLNSLRLPDNQTLNDFKKVLELFMVHVVDYANGNTISRFKLRKEIKAIQKEIKSRQWSNAFIQVIRHNPTKTHNLYILEDTILNFFRI